MGYIVTPSSLTTTPNSLFIFLPASARNGSMVQRFNKRGFGSGAQEFTEVKSVYIPWAPPEVSASANDEARRRAAKQSTTKPLLLAPRTIVVDDSAAAAYFLLFASIWMGCVVELVEGKLGTSIYP